MKKIKYNIAFIDATSSVTVLENLDSYGKLGWRFISFYEPKIPISTKADIRYAIFEVPNDEKSS